MNRGYSMHAESWVKTIKKLSCVKRFSQTEMAKTENVLDHTGMVALVCHHIGVSLINVDNVQVDIGSLLQKALLHDIEESEIGDVARPAKYSSDAVRHSFAGLEYETAMSIFEDAAMPASINIWAGSKSDDLEGQIVKYADALCAVIKFHDEIYIRGNMSMVDLMAPGLFDNLDKLLHNINNYTGLVSSRTVIEYYKLNNRMQYQISKRIV